MGARQLSWRIVLNNTVVGCFFYRDQILHVQVGRTLSVRGGQIGVHEMELTGALSCISSSIGMYRSYISTWNHSKYCIPLTTSSGGRLCSEPVCGSLGGNQVVDQVADLKRLEGRFPRIDRGRVIAELLSVLTELIVIHSARTERD